MLLFLALYMVVSTVYGLGRYTTPEDEIQPVQDWSEYGDYDVWVAARKMLKDLSQGSSGKTPQHEREESLETPQKAPEGSEINNIGPDKTYVNSHSLLVREDEQGLILAKPQADLLLKGIAYFGHQSSIYCYDENRIIFRFREGWYYQVTSIVPNPPELDTPFDIEGVSYSFSKRGVLGRIKGGNWLLETIHSGPNLDCHI
ncbi:unnamed protein product [Rhizoctonia solani]|uniref:Uncharacterized protein n=1 Tax=Rhizoctonia solani TaxID=456999 RepID=A0A8H3DIQ1_9AGAM|nr:unnamed protein product [Rhizoctonia solani]